MLHSLSSQLLSKFSGLPFGLELSLYSIHFFFQSLSSFCNTGPCHCKLFCCSTKIMLSNPSLCLNSLLGTLSFTLMSHIHLTVLNYILFYCIMPMIIWIVCECFLVTFSKLMMLVYIFSLLLQLTAENKQLRSSIVLILCNIHHCTKTWLLLQCESESHYTLVHNFIKMLTSFKNF